jgi:hypothetical protein
MAAKMPKIVWTTMSANIRVERLAVETEAGAPLSLRVRSNES